MLINYFKEFVGNLNLDDLIIDIFRDEPSEKESVKDEICEDLGYAVVVDDNGNDI